MNERDDSDAFDAYPIDETMISNEQLAVLMTLQLWNAATTIGQCRERLRGFQKIGDELGSS